MAPLVRTIRVEDAPQIKVLEVLCGLSPWPLEDYAAEAGREGSFTVVAEEGGAIFGFLIARDIGDALYILNLAVRPDQRERSIGTALLRFAEGAAKIYGLTIAQLEVREANSVARSFYERNGFLAQGRRKAFYSNPAEDAILMQKSIT